MNRLAKLLAAPALVLAIAGPSAAWTVAAGGFGAATATATTRTGTERQTQAAAERSVIDRLAELLERQLALIAEMEALDEKLDGLTARLNVEPAPETVEAIRLTVGELVRHRVEMRGVAEALQAATPCLTMVDMRGDMSRLTGLTECPFVTLLRRRTRDDTARVLSIRE